MLAIKQLKAAAVRNLGELTLEPEPGLNFFFGPNASGKTSVLETIYLLSRVKSFRTKRINNVISRGMSKLSVFASGHSAGKPFSVGVEKGRGLTRLKYNSEQVKTASEQARKLPVFVQTPDHHMLFTGGPRDRRHWLDWSMFHVEQDYLQTWKDYHRALRHRNAILKQDRLLDQGEIVGWEKMMVEEAYRIDAMRTNYLDALNRLLNEQCLPPVMGGHARVVYQHVGYTAEDLAQKLADGRQDDIKRGFTAAGPHRSEVLFEYDETVVARHLSRGQTKLYGAALLTAQMQRLKEFGISSILLMDDLDAELDNGAVTNLLSLLAGMEAQIFISSLNKNDLPVRQYREYGVFHVEHGNIKKVIQ